MLKLSIVIPVYNVEKYLSACLDSVLYPGLEGYEIVIVNDGSTDSSPAVAQEYRRRYPELIRLINTENGGLGAARNVGLEAASGEYLLFLDSDDYLRPNALPEIMAKLEEGFDICIFGMLSVTESGHVLDDIPSCGREGELSLAGYPRLLLCPPSACNKLCRRSLFMGSGIRFPSRVWYEDLRTMPKLYLLTDRIVATERQWYIYVQRSGSITRSANLHRNLEIMDALDDLIGYYKARGSYESYSNELEYTAFYNQFLTSVVRVCLAEPKSPVAEKLRCDFLKKFPNFTANPYVGEMPFKYRLLTRLILRRRYRTVGLIMGLNERVKGK